MASTHQPVAVTGSTGRIGGLVAARLAEAGRAQRLLVRDPARAPVYQGSEVVQSQYADRQSAVEALQGIEVLLMVSAAESASRLEDHFRFVDAAFEAGVQHIVYTSFAGASAQSTFLLGRDHAATEAHIRASGLSFTFLQDNLYSNFLPRMSGEDGVIRGPAGDGRLAAVAQEDVGAVAAEVMLEPASHENAAYELTGPEAFTLAEAAAVITAVMGRDVRYHAESIEEAYESRAKYGAPDWLVDAWVSTYTAIAVGELDRVTGDVESLLGRPSLSLEQVLHALQHPS